MPSLLIRSALLALLLLIEMLTLSMWLDTSNLRGSGFLTKIVGNLGPWAVRLPVTFAVFFLVFGNSGLKAAAQQASPGDRDARTSWKLLSVHLVLMLAFGSLSSMLFGDRAASDALTGVWIACGIAAVAAAALALIPGSVWLGIFRKTGDAWIFGLGATLAATLLGLAAGSLWKPASALTFAVVSALVRPFAPDLAMDAARLKLGTSRFEVIIAPECSGLEGIGMVLAFVAAWLWFFRSEYRFPQSLLLFPAGAVAVWTLNAVRLAGLFLIGHAGAAGVAGGGFHAQAGWIGFLLTVLVISTVSGRVAWFSRKTPVAKDAGSSARNPVAAFLVPFLAILAAALVARSASADFDWLYPLRFFAAAAALWFFRREYRRLNWRVGWEAPLTGAAVFALWMGLERLSPADGGQGIAAGLAGLSTPARAAWLCFRTAAAVITVPIAEELAFRGFLMRRLAAADFEAVSSRAFAFVPFAISSLAFGILHGDRWVAGAVAGMLYAGVFLRRGSIGDAAAAHATTNALLAAWVLATASWQLW